MKIFKILKGKMIALTGAATIFSTVICGAPITVFANTPKCTCESKCSEGHVDENCPVCKEDISMCKGTEESTEKPEEKKEEKMGPLTPDGNMSIVDDYGSIEAGGKQFITLTTKNGNYFYLIIDRDDEGKETVHFLNMVDESDLLSLMDEDQVKKYIAATTGDSTKEEKTPEIKKPETEKETAPATTSETKPAKEKKKTNVNGIMTIILVLALAAGGGFMYFKSTKNAKKKTNEPDPDEDYKEGSDDDYLTDIDDDIEDLSDEDDRALDEADTEIVVDDNTEDDSNEGDEK